MAKIKQADGSVIIPDGWIPASQISPTQSALISTLLAAWVRGKLGFPLTHQRLKHRYCSQVSWPESKKQVVNSDAWIIFSECSKSCCVNSASFPPKKTCGVESKWWDKQGSKQEAEKGNTMVIMRPGSKSARNKQIFKKSLISLKFSYQLKCSFLPGLISSLASWQWVFRADIWSHL